MKKKDKKKDNAGLLLGAFTVLVVSSMLASLALLYKESRK